MKKLYLDLDGVMADFDGHFEKLFGKTTSSVDDDEMWRMIREEETFFDSVPPCKLAISFFRWIEHLDPIVLTAAPKTFYQVGAQQKKNWVKRHLSEDVMVLPIHGGKNKHLFMHKPGDVLVDDFEKNIELWRAAGGIGVHHQNFEETKRLVEKHFPDKF